MEKKKIQCDDIVDKYGNYADLSMEIEAIEKFEYIKHNSSKNLRASQSRMIIGFILILCLTIVLGVFAFAMSRKSTDDIQYVYDGPLSVRYYALSLNVNAHKAYLSMRNLALSDEGDLQRIEYYVTRTRESMALVYDDFNMLKSLANNNEALKLRLSELEFLLEQWEKTRETYIQFALDGDMNSCRFGVTGPLTTMVDEVNGCISEIASAAADAAAFDYEAILTRSRTFDIFLIILTLVITIASMIVIISVHKYTSKATSLVAEAQNDQNKILDELMVMDETLRQNLATIEHEAEVISQMKERYANSLEAANDAIWELNLETNEFFSSEKWEDITGLSDMRIFDKESILQAIYNEDREKFTEAFKPQSGYFNIQVRARSSDDSSPRWLNIRGKWLDSHRLTGSVSDITQKKQSEQYIEYMAYHDSITHLPNRMMFVRTLENALEKAKKSGNGGCVLFIDLDNFKLINDSHGHNFGDKLLSEVAQRLRQTVSEEAMLARFGGDEFLILVENVTSEEAMHDYIQTVAEALSAPVFLDGGIFHVTASIGVSRFPEDGNDVTQILKNSDAAMYESKSAGRNTFAFYDKHMSAKLLRKNAIADILHTAIEDDSVYMVYQPQVQSSDHKVVGCEALMRLKSKELGFISPAEFIPVAEDTRLIVPLGYWAVRKAIETDLELRGKGVALNYISVNVSEMQLRERNFAHQVKKIVDEYNYDSSRLHFEITESILLANLDEEIAILNELRAIGAKIELDDFGTGYSSLNYVRMIPLDVIKIDKCFIDEIGINSEKEGLIDLIVHLANTLGTDVVAEGVETAAQVEFLKEKGEIILQGFYYSKPLEANDLQAKFEELNGIAKI